MPDAQPLTPPLTEALVPSEGFLARWSRDPGRWRARWHIGVFALAVAFSIFIAQIIDWPVAANLTIQAGEISPIDIRAPRPATYTSLLLTAEARERAAAGVPKIYDPAQTRVARQQLTTAVQVLDFIKQVRGDPLASEAQKAIWLQSVAPTPIDENTAAAILAVNNERWPAVAEEIVRVLDAAMRSVIREGELQAAQRAVPSLIGFGLSDAEASIVNVLVQGLIRPNSVFNAERTETAQAEAAERVQPVERTIAAGETIVRAGDRVEPLDIEAMGALDLLRSTRTWHDYAAAAVLSVLLTALLIVFVNQRQRTFWADGLRTLLLGVLIISFTMLAKMMTPLNTVVAYLFPLAAMTMLIGALIELPIATAATLVVGILILVFTRGEMEVAIYAIGGALAGALALGRAERLNAFARAGVWIIAANLATLAFFRLPLLKVADSRGLLELATAAVVNGIFASSFTLVVFYLLGQVLGLTTSLQLLDLSRPTHPLLRQLLLKAPGTYYHTLIVSNMVEEAANAIGADALLARVGAYYHDVGKSVRPYFFIENYTEGVNPHERLDPYTSARIIISHVPDGVELAKKYKLPQAIIDFVREHHGTTRVEYFYHQACQETDTPEDVDEKAFRYSGPKPRSRETAILMLADGCEATVRAMSPRTSQEMADLIQNVVSRRLMLGQLDDSGLTLSDLTHITEAFNRVLKGIHHPRIRYPDATPARPAAVAPTFTPSRPIPAP